MPRQHYPFYDTALLTTTAGVLTLFTTPEGFDTTHQSEDTNMRIGGQWAQGQTFTIEKISAFPDVALVEADIWTVWLENYIKVIIENRNVLQIPLRMCADYSAFNGQFAQASAANRVVIGAEGSGFMLKEPIKVGGGDQFKVELHQITVTNTASQRMKIVLDGILDSR